MALKSDFCAQYYSACAKALNLAADYCDRVAAEDMQGDPVYVNMTYPFVDEVKSTGTLTRLFDATIKLPGPVTGMYIRPGTNKWWVVGRQGVIKEIANDPKATASSIADILDITDRVIQDNQTWAGGQWEQGLLSMAFSPDFLTTGYFYVYYLKLTNAAIYERKALVSRFTWTGSSATTKDTEVIMMGIVQDTDFHKVAQGLTTYLIHLWEYDYEPLLGAANNHKHYSDLDDVNDAGAGYRGAQGVDTDGTAVGWVLTNECLQYTLTTFSAGKYIVKLNAGGPTELGGGSLQMDVFPGPGANAGVIPLQTYTLVHTATGGWNIKRDDVVATGIDMPAAPFTIRLTALSSGLNLQDITFVQTALATGGTASATTSSGALTSGSTTGAVDAGTGLLTYKMLLANYDYVVPGGLATNEAINYHDADPVNNAGNGFRGGEAVDATADEIGWARVGDWTQYTVADFKSGRYKLELTACGPNDIAVPGGSIRAFVLPAAPFTVRVTTTREGLNLRSLTFTEVPAPATVEGTVEAEQFDRGGAGFGYQDTTPANTGGATYRTLEGVTQAGTYTASLKLATGAAAATNRLRRTAVAETSSDGQVNFNNGIESKTGGKAEQARNLALTDTPPTLNGVNVYAFVVVVPGRCKDVVDPVCTTGAPIPYAGSTTNFVSVAAPAAYNMQLTEGFACLKLCTARDNFYIDSVALMKSVVDKTSGLPTYKITLSNYDYVDGGINTNVNYFDRDAANKGDATFRGNQLDFFSQPGANANAAPLKTVVLNHAATGGWDAPTVESSLGAASVVLPVGPFTVRMTVIKAGLNVFYLAFTQLPAAIVPAYPGLMSPVAGVTVDNAGMSKYFILLAEYDYVPGAANDPTHYHDTDVQNKASTTYRLGEGVDAAGNMWGNVGFIAAGEYTQYTLATFKAGKYVPYLSAAGPPVLGGCTIQLDFFKSPGPNTSVQPFLTMTVQHAATIDWGDYSDSPAIPAAAVPAGPWTLRVSTTKAGCNYRSLSFVQTS
ncbi:hypothetical protein JKP88DRAFT_288376 [Tribonema minus]|uniref:Uncharacterized protein n=1 Tax=Tribonema minus TaxID=303371 RepID=A0A836CIR9_9STRA|nr:hypothetical protein JKP88DRAFT_288376 [Tribonema minus]